MSKTIDFDADTTLIEFKFGGVVKHVKYRYDLSRDQIKSIRAAASSIKFNGNISKWIADVMEKAHEDESWKYEPKPDAWRMWSPGACTSIDVKSEEGV